MTEDGNLTWRERQIMDALWRMGQGSVEEVRGRLPGSPSYSTVRTLMGRMESKGLLEHREHDLKYVYSPAIPRAEARRSAAVRLLDVFYGGSLAEAVAGLVGAAGSGVSDEELAEIERAIVEAKARRVRGSE